MIKWDVIHVFEGRMTSDQKDAVNNLSVATGVYNASGDRSIIGMHIIAEYATIAAMRAGELIRNTLDREHLDVHSITIKRA